MCAAFCRVPGLLAYTASCLCCPQPSGTHPLQFSVSAYPGCVLCLDPFIFPWLHMIRCTQDVAFIGHEIKESAEHEETSWLHLVRKCCLCVGYVTVLDVQHPCLCQPARHAQGSTHTSLQPHFLHSYTH